MKWYEKQVPKTLFFERGSGYHADYIKVYFNGAIGWTSQDTLDSTQKYYYGSDISWSKRIARYAEEDYIRAQKYGWQSWYYRKKPYYKYFLADLAAKYGATKISDADHAKSWSIKEFLDEADADKED